MDEKIRKLYDNLVADNYDLPDFDTFKLDMEDDVKSNKLYQTLVGDSYDLPDYDTFLSDIRVKKKSILSNWLQKAKLFFKNLVCLQKNP